MTFSVDLTAVDLPVVKVLPALRSALRDHPSVVLQAPPGAGKSTVVPLALLQESWLQGRRILMLEPRRLAARAVAERMADSLAERVGQTVGYRMRLDTRVSASTRIEVVTEGILLRLLQADPTLEGVGLVIFDEFHERNLQSDLGLALLLDARAALASDLKVLVMSATLETQALEAYLQGSLCVTAEGRQYPVEILHRGNALPALPGEGLELQVIQTIRCALKDHAGDVLVFLPGSAEIRRVVSGLVDLPTSVRVWPLYGELSPADQDAALQPAPAGMRHVILATNIAETSLTLPGVRVVIDSGLARRSRFDAGSGMSRLETIRISRASADQRAGRAGRVAAGVCYRLWSEGSERGMAAHTPPEIVEADLAPLALELAVWGAHHPSALAWLDPPAASTFEAARSLLRDLGILDSNGRLTERGREIAVWPVHPRLGRLLWEARERDWIDLGVGLAALLSERDPLRARSRQAETTREEDIDLLTRLNILLRREFTDQPNPGVWRRIERYAVQLRRGMAVAHRPHMADRSIVPRSIAQRSTSKSSVVADEAAAEECAAILLASAFADRIAQPREGVRGRYRLANGRGAYLRMPDRLANAPLLVAVELDGAERDALIRLAVAITPQQLTSALADIFETTTTVQWSIQEQALISQEQCRLGSLILTSRAVEIDAAQQAAIVARTITTSLGLQVLPWTNEARQYCARIEMLRHLPNPSSPSSPSNSPDPPNPLSPDFADWPSFSESALLSSVTDWLEPWLLGVSRQSHFNQIPLLQALKYRLGHSRESLLARWMPEHWVLPTGTRVSIDYLDDLAPVAAMRMQEVFGLASTPCIAEGMLPITFKLLSPAGRPLQVTRDLASFWRNAYTEVRKDMRGRYPKHYWPENPLLAEPTRRTKPRT